MYSPYARCRHLLVATTVALLLCGLAATAESAAPGRVFLTFDDGPIDVTLDILDVLKAQGTRATFFVNAIHLDGRGGENEDRAGEALRRIILEGHVLGNHSHNHMNHNRPAGVYAIGAAEAYGNLETDLSYFVPANVVVVNAVLGPLATRSNNRIASIARLPYSNVWMFAQLGTVCQWCGIASGPFWHPDARANSAREVSDAAGQLAVVLNQRHKIDSFGWDVHWQPRGWALPKVNETMPSAAVIEKEILALMKDEPYCVPGSAGGHCKAPVRKNNVIVLVHDFLFENGSRGRGKDINLPQLIALITSLKSQGYTFATLDHYLD